jgi:hypothetical protein
MARTALIVGVALCSLGASCGGDDDGPGGGTPMLEIGEGDIGEYDAIEPDQVVHLVRGPQGGQHVWVALRAWNIDTAPAVIQLLVERERDMYAASVPYQVRLRFQDPIPDGETYTQISGLTAIIIEPDDVLGEPCILRARVTENRGDMLAVESSVRVFIEWAPTEDAGPPPDGSIPIDAGDPTDGGVAADGGELDGGVDGG